MKENNEEKVMMSLGLCNIIDKVDDVIQNLDRNTKTKEEGLNWSASQTFLWCIAMDKTCNGGKILRKNLTSDELANLTKELKPTLIKDAYNESSELLKKSIYEKNALEKDELATEHVVLAILNPKNNFRASATLRNTPLNYEIMVEECKSIKPKKVRNKQTMSFNDTPSAIGSEDAINMKKNEIIEKYTTNLYDEVVNGKFDPFIGRENTLRNVVKALSRRKKNNVVLVGKEGVGKTSVGYGLAELIASGNVPDCLKEKQVVLLNNTALVSGTSLRGMLEERVDKLFGELKKSSNYILFIDDIQNVIKSSSKERDSDLTEHLSKILNGGEVRVIGTCSFKNYRNGIENNAVLNGKFQKIVIDPMTTSETIQVLKQNKENYEKFHHVIFDENSIDTIVKLAQRYITNNQLPTSAIDLIDLVGASVNMSSNSKSSKVSELEKGLAQLNDDRLTCLTKGDLEKAKDLEKEINNFKKKISDVKKKMEKDQDSWHNVTEQEITDVVSELTNIPVSKLTKSDKSLILNIGDILKKDVIGQDEAVNEIAKAIKRNKAGFGDKNKPITLFFGGSSGVGKTLIAKKLAENIFGDAKALVRFDMSEYQDKTSVNKLLGSSAGYVGYENGGILTEAIKNKPYCVLLFDEIEKADESIYNVFLQLFDEGRLTDNNGTTVNFQNVIVIMTSNIGAKESNENGKSVGFVDASSVKKLSIIQRALKNRFNPEFINRIDKIIYFNTLTHENLMKIAELELSKLQDRLSENKISFTYDNEVLEFIHDQAIKQIEYGARPIMRIIQESISDKMVDLVLGNEAEEQSYKISIKDDDIVVE